MIELHHTTAILVFSRSAAAEIRAKKLAFDPRKARPVAQLMIENVRRLVESTKIPYFFFTEKHQVGNDFGARITHAFESIFAKGFDNVVCIGNDCLTLSKTDILNAAQALNTDSNAVFAKTTDGGAYLIGFQKSAFDATAFQQIGWQSSTVFEELLRFSADRNLQITCLHEKMDIDNFVQWKIILGTIALPLKNAFLRLLSFFKPFFQPQLQPLPLGFMPISGLLRAPPF